LPYRFQARRFPNFETSWFFLYSHLKHIGGRFWADTYPRLSSLLSGALFVAGAALLVWLESRRPRIRPYVLTFGLLVWFLITGKVYSPQYALWLLPLFVLVHMRWYAYAAFVLTDVAVWVGISAYFLSQPPHNVGDPQLRLNLLEVAVWVRYAVLLWLLWLTRRADENVAQPEVAEYAALVSPVRSPA
jgi:hypothetical protein